MLIGRGYAIVNLTQFLGLKTRARWIYGLWDTKWELWGLRPLYSAIIAERNSSLNEMQWFPPSPCLKLHYPRTAYRNFLHPSILNRWTTLSSSFTTTLCLFSIAHASSVCPSPSFKLASTMLKSSSNFTTVWYPFYVAGNSGIRPSSSITLMFITLSLNTLRSRSYIASSCSKMQYMCYS